MTDAVVVAGGMEEVVIVMEDVTGGMMDVGTAGVVTGAEGMVVVDQTTMIIPLAGTTTVAHAMIEDTEVSLFYNLLRSFPYFVLAA